MDGWSSKSYSMSNCTWFDLPVGSFLSFSRNEKLTCFSAIDSGQTPLAHHGTTRTTLHNTFQVLQVLW